MSGLQYIFTEIAPTLPPSLSTRSSTSSASASSSLFQEEDFDIGDALGLVHSPVLFGPLDLNMSSNYDYNFPLDHDSTSPNYSDLTSSPQVPVKRFSDSSLYSQSAPSVTIPHQPTLLHYEPTAPVAPMVPMVPPAPMAPPVYFPQEAYWPLPTHSLQHTPAPTQHHFPVPDVSWSPTFESHPQTMSAVIPPSLPLPYPESQSTPALDHTSGLASSSEFYNRPLGYSPQPRLTNMTQAQLLTFKAGYEMGLSQKSSISEYASSSRGPQSTFNQYRRSSSRRLSRTSSGSSIPTISSVSVDSVPPSPTKPQGSIVPSHHSIPEHLDSAENPDSDCNVGIPNEYMWLALPKLTRQFRDQVLHLALEKCSQNVGNKAIPDVGTVTSILDSFAQSHVSLKLTIMNALYGASNNTDIHTSTRLPKMAIRETGHTTEILIQTSNGVDLARPDFINKALNGLRNCPVLRNQLCKTRVDVVTNTDKRPYNSWFLYRGAQMNRASILKITECLPDDYETLMAMKEAVLYGIGVANKEDYIAHLRELYLDPHDVRADLTSLGYVVAYMWNLESSEVKRKLTEFSRVEHAHKLKVFPCYRYAPKKNRKRASFS